MKWIAFRCKINEGNKNMNTLLISKYEQFWRSDCTPLMPIDLAVKSSYSWIYGFWISEFYFSIWNRVICAFCSIICKAQDFSAEIHFFVFLICKVNVFSPYVLFFCLFICVFFSFCKNYDPTPNLHPQQCSSFTY